MAESAVTSPTLVQQIAAALHKHHSVDLIGFDGLPPDEFICCAETVVAVVGDALAAAEADASRERALAEDLFRLVRHRGSYACAGAPLCMHCSAAKVYAAARSVDREDFAEAEAPGAPTPGGDRG